VFIKLVHDVWSAVHDRLSLVFGVFADPIAGKATNLMFINGLDYIDVFLNG